ncbi:hypothetical protein PsAD46_01025 [Pseudovibrio sp. Ad46]|nr:hypothetical protein PsAD46_01025 [Pseudovibrio sp. Ad46]
MQLIHINRLNTAFNHQITVFRHHQHERVTRCDHAANSVNVELVHITGLWRADVNALEAVLRSHFLLFQLGNLRADVLQVRQNFFQKLFVQLQDLHALFADGFLGLSDLRDQPTAVPNQLGPFPLDGGDLRGVDQALFQKRSKVGELLRDKINAFGFRIALHL